MGPYGVLALRMSMEKLFAISIHGCESMLYITCYILLILCEYGKLFRDLWSLHYVIDREP